MIKFPKSEWIHNWGINQENANYLYEQIIKTKPKVIIETGTFEGQGTYILAKACHDNNNQANIYTIDYDGDPTLELDIDKWKKLKNIRDKNLKKIKEEFSNVNVIFLDGDSRIVLKTLFNDYKIDKIDLFYQDSMHFEDGIRSEWTLVEPYIKKNCITIFDDLKLKGVRAFMQWFKNKYKHSFNYTEILDGHAQFVTQKV